MKLDSVAGHRVCVHSLSCLEELFLSSSMAQHYFQLENSERIMGRNLCCLKEVWGVSITAKSMSEAGSSSIHTC